MINLVVTSLTGSLSNHEDDTKTTRRRQEHQKFAYLTTEKSSFSRFSHAFIFACLYISQLFSSFRRREMTCLAVSVNIWRQILSFLSPSLGRSPQFHSRRFSKHFFKLNDLIEEWLQKTRSHIFRWRSRCRRSRHGSSSLMFVPTTLQRM